MTAEEFLDAFEAVVNAVPDGPTRRRLSSAVKKRRREIAAGPVPHASAAAAPAISQDEIDRLIVIETKTKSALRALDAVGFDYDSAKRTIRYVRSVVFNDPWGGARMCSTGEALGAPYGKGQKAPAPCTDYDVQTICTTLKANVADMDLTGRWESARRLEQAAELLQCWAPIIEGLTPRETPAAPEPAAPPPPAATPKHDAPYDVYVRMAEPFRAAFLKGWF